MLSRLSILYECAEITSTMTSYNFTCLSWLLQLPMFQVVELVDEGLVSLQTGRYLIQNSSSVLAHQRIVRLLNYSRKLATSDAHRTQQQHAFYHCQNSVTLNNCQSFTSTCYGLGNCKCRHCA